MKKARRITTRFLWSSASVHDKRGRSEDLGETLHVIRYYEKVGTEIGDDVCEDEQ